MTTRRATRHSTRSQPVSYHEWSSSSEADYEQGRQEAEDEDTDGVAAEEQDSENDTPTFIRERPTKRRKTQRNAAQRGARSAPSRTLHANYMTGPLAIFRYAAAPLRDELLIHPQASIQWLLATSRVCHTFKEPALAALYESPPLTELAGPHRLLSSLRTDPAHLSMQYDSKIKKLELDAIRTLAYTSYGRGLIDLVQLIVHMPQLSEIDLRDSSERPPYRRLHSGKGWVYPENLFTDLSTCGTQLRRWHWNAHMIKQQSSVTAFSPRVAEMMRAAHSLPSLNQLKELSLSQFGPASPQRSPKNTANDNAPSAIAQRVSSVLEPLKKLTAMSLISCSAFEKSWMEVLQSLPSKLSSLTLSNTQFLDSLAVRDFLRDHGSCLKELVLDHNQSLDLSFTTDLCETCPQLERLHMDLTYFNQVANYEDNKPLFDALLLQDERPRWPTALQSLELYNLRQWTSDAAENFFMSLIDSAHELSSLRYLVIKAILDISWRDRANFRETWISSLKDVFLRNSPDPDPRLVSRRAFREAGPFNRSHDGCTLTAETPVRSVSAEPALEGRARRSTRIQTYTSQRAEQAEEESSDDDCAVVPRRAWKLPSKPFIQGLCEVVDISIDNNRPGEVQFHEEDFLDTDPGEDEEWVE
ncbi:MAG: hypothetical protein Q9159_003049 [Coniocarpon cinnabarinum]